MQPSPLARLLRPRTIAVVGGGAWCEAVLLQCRRAGFDGALHAVHPRRETIAGVRAWPDVAALPETPDATFVGVNRDATIEVVQALAERGAGGAVCFANGFAESADTGGAARQHALLHAAGDIALLGPNCYGFVNGLDGVALWPDQHGIRRVARGVAVLTQSSNIALNLSMQRRGLPIAYLVTSGNQAQQGFAAIGEALLADPRVTALGLHVEGFGEVRALERLAVRAARLGKPIVALKVGRSAAARRATLSHTASLAGSEAGADALMRRLGIARADSLATLVGTLQLVHAQDTLCSTLGNAHHGTFGDTPHGTLDTTPGDSLSGTADDARDHAVEHGPATEGECGVSGDDPQDTVRVASLSCSGGEAALVADAAARDAHAPGGTGTSTGQDDRPHIVFPALGETRRRTLAAALGPRVALANPLDYDTGIWRDGDALHAVYAAMTGPDIDLTLLVLDFPREDRCDASDWETPVAALERAARDTGARFALVATLPENLPEHIALRLLGSGIAPLAGIDEALEAVRAAATLGTSRNTSRGLPRDAPTMSHEPVPLLLAEAPAHASPLSEARAKSLLATAGVRVPHGRAATSPAQAEAEATRLGFPVVLKGQGLAHKSDVGGVVLGLRDGASVRRAAASMPCTDFLVEEMIEGGVVELLVGVVRDPAHGFVLTLAAGGLFAELLADSRSLLLPCTSNDVNGALDRLRVAPRIAGVRGRPCADRRAIVETVMAVQDLVVANAARIVELEINPLVALPHGAVALDALLVADPAVDACAAGTADTGTPTLATLAIGDADPDTRPSGVPVTLTDTGEPD